ncbi:hypothetical protein QTP86_028557 [Hemibagrus guttatus]|nr:hypothetical protein QTP86_028557 [Hemibagrus guttatus]
MARRLVARESGEWESMMMKMKMKDGVEEKRSSAVVTKKRGYDITRNPYLNKFGVQSQHKLHFQGQAPAHLNQSDVLEDMFVCDGAPKVHARSGHGVMFVCFSCWLRAEPGVLKVSVSVPPSDSCLC